MNTRFWLCPLILAPLCYTFQSQTSQSSSMWTCLLSDWTAPPAPPAFVWDEWSWTIHTSVISTLTWSLCTPQCLYRLWDEKWECLFLLSSPGHKWARRHFCEVAFIGFQWCHGHLLTVFISCEISRTLLEGRIENLLYSMQAHRQVKMIIYSLKT